MSERRIIKTSEVTPLPVTAKVLNTHSTSETDTYSCNYITNLQSKNVIYSTDEIIVGKFAGKNVYRKMIVTTTPSELNADVPIASLPAEQLGLLDLRGMLYNPDIPAVIPVPYAFNQTNSGTIFFNPVSKQIMMVLTNNIYTNKEISIIADYTKSTD